MVPCKSYHGGIMTSETKEVTCKKCIIIMKKKKINKSITIDILKKAT